MRTLLDLIEERAAHGFGFVTRQDIESALAELPTSTRKKQHVRAVQRGRLAMVRHGFYVILRPEDRIQGAPDPLLWIDPLMRHQGLDYRVSLLRAAARYGGTHHASMVLQVVAPRQLRPIEIGRQRIEFVSQQPGMFRRTNSKEWLEGWKTDAGITKVAGRELTLLDSIRYFHLATGIHGVAQIVKDVGNEADPRRLSKLAQLYESSVVRRLGYLLELAGLDRQARALVPFARSARTETKLDPSHRTLSKSLAQPRQINERWRLIITEPVEFDD